MNMDPSNTDDETDDTGAQDAEALRVDAMRTFQVKTASGDTETIFAHYHENNNPQGHLNFFTVLADGRHVSTDGFACGEWKRYKEVQNERTIAAASTIAERARAEQAAMYVPRSRRAH